MKLLPLAALAAAAALTGAAVAVPAPASGSMDSNEWLSAPSDFVIAAVFDRPDSDWGAGHRGIDLRLEADSPVLSPGDGVVTFAGDVAGRGIVVVRHASGLRSTLEPVRPSVETGDTVARGDSVGVLTLHGSHCAPLACVHWGVRRGEEYVDPLDVLGGVGPIRLLPLRD